jgi:hypothetical protein
LLLATLLVLVMPTATACQESDVDEAASQMATDLAALEEIAGPVLDAEVPPLPESPKPRLSRADEVFTARLRTTPPTEWTAEERERLELLLLADQPSLWGEEAVAPDDLSRRATELLSTARLLALRDRLAVLQGDAAQAVDGIVRRIDLGSDLSAQPGLVTLITAGAIHRDALLDVHLLTGRPETSRDSLARLETALLLWRHDAADPAAALAADLLRSLETLERQRRGLAGAPEAAVVYGPWASEVLRIARDCREVGCKAAADAARDRVQQGADDPTRAVASFAIPNLLDTVERADADHQLTRLAHLALALRLEAGERGTYPKTVDEVAARLGFAPDEIARIVYRKNPAGDADVGMAEDSRDRLNLGGAPPETRQNLTRLLTWSLPSPVPQPQEPIAGLWTEAPERRVSP